MADTLFENVQWKVTKFGVEAKLGTTTPHMLGRTSTYEFEAKRLLERTERGKEEFYDWPLHMAEKTWVDTEQFLEAYSTALKLHAGAYDGKIDDEMLQRSLEEARRITERRRHT